MKKALHSFAPINLIALVMFAFLIVFLHTFLHSCATPRPPVPAAVDIPQLAAQLADYIATTPCTPSGHIAAANTTERFAAQLPTDAQAAVAALLHLDPYQGPLAGNHHIDTLHTAAYTRLRYTPLPDHDVDVDDADAERAATQTLDLWLDIWLDKETQALLQLQGSRTQQKHVYVLHYDLKATFIEGKLAQYELAGYEQVGWYDTLHYRWQLTCIEDPLPPAL